ncbi:MAG: nonstructural protein [Microvirus sp.]|nr:MAG: nonstructural protein [Microvirus sp.]
MNLNIYSIHDSKAIRFSAPFFVPNDQLAIRAFERAVLDPASDVSHFPSDFTLYVLGQFDDATGAIDLHPQPKQLVNALNLKGN